jgi:hypothetical protein
MPIVRSLVPVPRPASQTMRDKCFPCKSCDKFRHLKKVKKKHYFVALMEKSSLIHVLSSGCTEAYRAFQLVIGMPGWLEITRGKGKTATRQIATSTIHQWLLYNHDAIPV